MPCCHTKQLPGDLGRPVQEGCEDVPVLTSVTRVLTVSMELPEALHCFLGESQGLSLASSGTHSADLKGHSDMVEHTVIW